MPRIDPVTGCPVMTQGEFWNAEAAAEGKGRTGGDLQADFFEEVEASFAAEADTLRKPDVALATLRRGVFEWNEADPAADDAVDAVPMPAEVLEVLDASVSGGLRAQRTAIRARVRAEDGKVGVVTFTETQTSGTMLDPPDYESDLRWEPD